MRCDAMPQAVRNRVDRGFLKGVVFIRTNLTGADFSGAAIVDSQNPVFPTDFSFANLTKAKFVGTTFGGPTYLTYATLGCTDFSSTHLNNGHAIFGDAPLVLGDDSNCRTAFRGSTMNCEFVSQWDRLDLSGAAIGACASRLQTVAGHAPHDFSNGLYTGVVFDNLDLSGTKWSGAVLEHASFQGATLDGATGLNGTSEVKSRLSGAKFNQASVQNVNLSNAQLYGATFDNANLSGSSFEVSFLTSNPDAKTPILTAASFAGAYMKDVSLANAKLMGAGFQFASLYSSSGGSQQACNSQPSPRLHCATVAGADLTQTHFDSAYLYGVDFSGATVNSTNFGSAVLVAANFAGAKFLVSDGVALNFQQALLQGTQFDANAALSGSDLKDAFLDFGVVGSASNGNILTLRLSSAYTRFNGRKGAQTPCVMTSYDHYSTFPRATEIPMICPDGFSGVCGPTGLPMPANSHWRSTLSLSRNTPVAGYYYLPATFDPAPLAPLGPPGSSLPLSTCDGQPVDSNW